MRTLLKVGFSLLVLAFVLIGLTYSMLKAQGVASPSHSAGRAVTSETRPVAANVTALELIGPMDLVMRHGPTPSLTVSGEQRLLGNIVTMAEGSTLHIGTKGVLFHHRRPIQVELVLPSIRRLDLHGTGERTINGFSGERLEIEVHGAGNAIFNGRYRDISAAVYGSGALELNGGTGSDKVEVQLMGPGRVVVVGGSKVFKGEQTGSGELDAQHLRAGTAEIELSGSGTAAMTAKESATVNLHGSGDVTVYGSPNQRHVSRTGAGEVSWSH